MFQILIFLRIRFFLTSNYYFQLFFNCINYMNAFRISDELFWVFSGNKSLSVNTSNICQTNTPNEQLILIRQGFVEFVEFLYIEKIQHLYILSYYKFTEVLSGIRLHVKTGGRRGEILSYFPSVFNFIPRKRFIGMQFSFP